MLARLFWMWALLVAAVAARKQAPLMDEDGVRTRNKAAECVFGKQVRELGSQWIPDLGVPIGVLYCMKCECVPVQKKRRIVARVQCRSIKKECPEPTCDEPVHLPGRCCKTCPGDPEETIKEIIPQNHPVEEEKNKHYAALLTGRSSLTLKNDYMKPIPADNMNNVAATGRFTFHKKNLHYSFYISDKAARPRSLQFGDADNNILEEFVLSRTGGLVNSLYQNATRKVCGVWKRIPRDYCRLLKQEKLFVTLVWGTKDQAEFTVSGQLKKYQALSTELYSSLMEPAPGTNSLAMAGAGGTAIVSISTSVPTSIHLSVVFNGLFTSDEVAETPLNISLSLDDKKFILQETVYVKKPMHDLNLVKISADISFDNLCLLTSGLLLVSLSSVSQPESLRLSGSVITKVKCELFQTTLSSTPSDPNANPAGTSGLAWLYLNNEGSLVYNVQIDNLKQQIPVDITLVDLSTKRRTELEELTPHIVDGWANGTVQLSPKVLEPLYAGNLGVNVATVADSSLIRGRLVAKPVADARDAPAPYLLKRENYTLPASAVGLAWLYVDNECHLHYDVALSGLGAGDRKLELALELLPKVAPGAPNTTRELEDFQGAQAEGSPLDALNGEELSLLDSGVGFLKVKDKRTRITLLTATVGRVAVPLNCRPSASYADNNVGESPLDDPAPPMRHMCYYEHKFYEEETLWTTAANPCTTCFCQGGVDKCFTMQCPVLECADGAVPVSVNGECCPVCPMAGGKCNFDGKPYSAGSRFHPFLIPTGFDACTECTCDAKTLETKCKRITDEKECCPNCAAGNEGFMDDHMPLITALPRKEESSSSSERVLADGGCKNMYNPNKPYENGSEYHPRIASLGEYKCVNCKCNNGTTECKPQHCDKATCAKIFKLKKAGTPVNSAEYCCSMKDCRKFRHRKNHRRLHQSS